MTTDTEVEPSSYFALIALGKEDMQLSACQFLLQLQAVICPYAGIFFAAGIIYVVSLPVRALWKALPQKKPAKTPKRPVCLPDESPL